MDRYLTEKRHCALYLAASSLIAGILLSCAAMTPEAHYNWAVEYAQQDRLSEAEREYELAISAKPDLIQAHNNLGALYLKQGRLSKAEHAFKAALSIKRDYPVALENLASTYEAMGGRDQTALETWKTALDYETRPDIKSRIAQRVAELEARLFSSEPPALTVFSPIPDQVVSTDHLRIEGEASSPVGIDRLTVLVNGKPAGEGMRGIGGIAPGKIPPGQPYRFEQEVTLRSGENEIMVTAYDRRDLSASRTIKVTRTPVQPVRYYEKSWGVVIGVNKYTYWPGLEYAVNDANRMAAKLRDLGFDEVIKIMDSQATRERILNLLGTELPRRVGKEDRVFIFFAGHGQTEELSTGRQKGYLIPVEGSVTDYFTTAISMEQVREFSERIPAKHVYYAIDACYSGLGFTRAQGLNPNMPGYLEKVTRLRAVQMVTAGGKDEQVVERGGLGLFTEYLLRALDGEADMDTDGVITATELGAFLRPQVSVASENRQTPQYGRLDGDGEVIFIPPVK